MVVWLRARVFCVCIGGSFSAFAVHSCGRRLLLFFIVFGVSWHSSYTKNRTVIQIEQFFFSFFLWKKRLSAYFGTKTVIQDVFCMIDCSIRLLSWPPPSISNGKRIDQLLLSKNDIWLVLASSDSNMHRYCGFHLTTTGCNPKQSFAEITFKITYNPWKEMFRHRII